eukprot:GFYU01002317.1.p1 GENE.GFYU01002317.1~~GFYU01002317.1.p1  ORF type:complete len:430 (+),score=36.94 GFYU01002317.1:170-1459(+)
MSEPNLVTTLERVLALADQSHLGGKVESGDGNACDSEGVDTLDYASLWCGLWQNECLFGATGLKPNVLEERRRLQALRIVHERNLMGHTITLDVSGVAVDVTVSLEEAWTVVLPICMFLLDCVYRQKNVHLMTSTHADLSPTPLNTTALLHRALLGVVGPAGTGKTTLSKVLAEYCCCLALHGTSIWDCGGTPGQGSTKRIDTSAVVGAAAVHSMDSYHFPNAYLDVTPKGTVSAASASTDDTVASQTTASTVSLQESLRSIKGRPPTIDVDNFVRDLTLLTEPSSTLGGNGSGKSDGTQRNASDASGTDSTCVRLPEYDRKLHDPVENRVVISSVTKVVIVEGLYLLRQEGRWAEVAEAFVASVYIHVPKELCKSRVVERKVQTGRERAEAEDFYDRNDAVTYDEVELDAARAQICITFDEHGRYCVL